MTGRIKVAGRLAALAVALVSLAALASAGPAYAEDGRSSTVGGFAAQVSQAGLTAIEAGQLQSKVDGYLAAFGGSQVSANRIEFPGGYIVVAAPGQTYADDLATPAMYIDPRACPHYHFCMYRGMSYTGDYMFLYHCTEVALSNWVGWGSYLNNQTSGTMTVMYDRNHRWYVGSIAPHTNPQFNWDPVWYVDPC